MTWALVQKSAAVAHATTGTVAAALPAASTAGTLLVAQIGANGSAGTWSAPPNWVITETAVNGATVNNSAIAWLLPASNPGGATSFSFTFGANTINAQVMEFSFTSGATVTLNASGTGTAGAVASLALSASGAAAGDLAVCGFQEHLTAAAVTWTDPSGWTAANETTASAGNQEYAAYQLGTASGTLSVTGTSSAASTLTTGWTGIVVTFTAASTGASPNAGLAAATGTAGTAAVTGPAAVSPVGTPAATTYTTVNGSNTVTSTWSGTQPRTAGDTLVMIVTAAAVTSVTVPQYTSLGAGWWCALTSQNEVTNGPNCWTGIFCKTATGADAAPSLTIVTSGTTRIGCTLVELSGASPLGGYPLDGAGMYASGAPAATLSAMTAATQAPVSAPGEYAIAAFSRVQGSAATATWTPGTGFTNLANDGAVSGVCHSAVDCLAGPAAGAACSDAASFTSAASAYGAGGVVVFAAGPPPPYVIASPSLASGASSYTIPVTAPANLMDGVSVAIAVGGAVPPSVTGVTDTQGNVYTLAQQSGTPSPDLAVYTSIGRMALTTSDTITVTFSGSTASAPAVAVVGTPGLQLLDVSTLTNGSSATASASGIPGPNETMLAFFGWGNTGGTGAGVTGSGFTQLTQAHNGTGAYLTAGYLTQAAGGSALTATDTITSAAWHAVMLSFGPFYMSSATYITRMNTADPVTAAQFFSSPASFSISTTQSAPGAIPSGFTTTPVLKYISYYQFLADVSLANQVFGGTTYQFAAISAAYKWVLYDTENWSPNPPATYNDNAPGGPYPEAQAEIDDPWTYMASFVTLAHAHGYQVILTPSRDLSADATTARALQSGESSSTPAGWWIRTGIGLASAQSGAEVTEVQDQANDLNLPLYQSYWYSYLAQVKAGSATAVPMAGIRSNDAGGTGALLYSTATSIYGNSGFWLNSTNATIPVATAFLDLMWTAPGSPATNATAGLAAATGTALQAGGQNAGLPAGSAAALTPSVIAGGTHASARLATAAAVMIDGSYSATYGTTYAGTASITARAGLAVATGTALNATVGTSGGTSANAGLAAGAGWAALNATITGSGTANAGLAPASGAVPFTAGSTVSLTLTAVSPVGSAGAALNAAVTTGSGSGTSPAAGLAAAAAAGNSATAASSSTSAPAGLAAATGTAQSSVPSPVGTTRRIHGRAGVAYLSLASGAAASPVAFLAGWDIGWALNPVDVTVVTDIQHLYVAGQPSSAGSFTGFFDTATAQTYAAAVDGQPRNLYLYPSTLNPGQFFSGAVLPDYLLSGSAAGAVKLSVSWSSSGLVTATGL